MANDDKAATAQDSADMDPMSVIRSALAAVGPVDPEFRAKLFSLLPAVMPAVTKFLKRREERLSAHPVPPAPAPEADALRGSERYDWEHHIPVFDWED